LALPWQKAIRAALDGAGQEAAADTKVAAAAKDLAAWNGEFTQDSTAATTMWRLRLKAEGAINTGAIAGDQPLAAEDEARLGQLLAETVAEIEQTYGKFPVAWGE